MSLLKKYSQAVDSLDESTMNQYSKVYLFRRLYFAMDETYQIQIASLN